MYPRLIKIKKLDTMKRFLLILCLGLFYSCTDDFLDQVPNDRLTFEDAFNARKTAEQYLASIYNRIPTPHTQGLFIAGADEAVFVSPDFIASQLNRGDWNSASGFVYDKWNNYYIGIRDASTFMDNIDKCQDCQQDRINQYKAEARILRAYYYYKLIRLFGPVVILDGAIPADAGPDEMIKSRNTIEENVDYIVNELDAGADALTDVPFRGNVAGRMSRPFALAIKERVLLWAASPLFNGNTDYVDFTNADGEQLVPTTYDESKWQRAANAAKAFIDEFVPGQFDLYKVYNNDGSYNPYLSVRDVVVDDWNEEIIYAKPGFNRAYRSDAFPFHQGYPNEVRGGGRLAVTQDVVDAYFTANGRTIDDPQANYQQDGFVQFQAPFDYQQRETYAQWANREPRFYAGVTYNGSLWLDRNFGDVITTTWYNGNSGRGAGPNEYPLTGYIIRKRVILDRASSSPIMRLAEVYLDYVEALNEYDPSNPDILKYLNLVRERAGIPEYGSNTLAAPATQDEMREAIRRERRVELAFEQARYFDGRRWKIAEEAFEGAFYGLDIDARNLDDFYNVVEFETRVFTKRHYLWPIPQYEINRVPTMTQNPFWAQGD